MVERNSTCRVNNRPTLPTGLLRNAWSGEFCGTWHDLKVQLSSSSVGRASVVDFDLNALRPGFFLFTQIGVLTVPLIIHNSPIEFRREVGQCRLAHSRTHRQMVDESSQRGGRGGLHRSGYQIRA